jgi:hypothetical protein
MAQTALGQVMTMLKGQAASLEGETQWDPNSGPLVMSQNSKWQHSWPTGRLSGPPVMPLAGMLPA